MESKVTKTITLTMNEQEAAWLKGMVQNTKGPNEHPESAAIRKAFWDALVEALPNEPTTTMRYKPATLEVKGR